MERAKLDDSGKSDRERVCVCMLQRERKRESMSVFVCACCRERERERESSLKVEPDQDGSNTAFFRLVIQRRRKSDSLQKKNSHVSDSTQLGFREVAAETQLLVETDCICN